MQNAEGLSNHERGGYGSNKGTGDGLPGQLKTAALIFGDGLVTGILACHTLSFSDYPCFLIRADVWPEFLWRP